MRVYNFQEEMLRWIDLPILNPSNRDHLLAPEKAREYIDTNELSFDELKGHVPDLQADTEEKTALKKAKELDKAHTFRAYKVRAVVIWDQCGASLPMYNNNAVGTKAGPMETEQSELKAYLKNGYICSSAIPSDGKFFVRRQSCCGDYIEAYYYNPAEGI